MTKEEWLAEFERLNGRPATEAELAQAFPAEEAPKTAAIVDSPQGDMMGSTGPTGAAFQSPLAPEPPKPSLGKRVLSGLGTVVVIAAIVVGYLWFNNWRNGIDGTWRSRNSEDLPAWFTEGDSDAYNELKVTNGTYEMASVIDLDEKGEDYESYKAFVKTLAESSEANKDDMTFDEKTGLARFVIGRGKVHADTKQIESTEENGEKVTREKRYADYVRKGDRLKIGDDMEYERVK